MKTRSFTHVGRVGGRGVIGRRTKRMVQLEEELDHEKDDRNEKHEREQDNHTK